MALLHLVYCLQYWPLVNAWEEGDNRANVVTLALNGLPASYDLWLGVS